MNWVYRVTLISTLIVALAPHSCAAPSKSDKWFSSDKFKHFTVSAFYSAGTSIIANKHFDIGKKPSLNIGLGFTISLGAVKELKDMRSPNESSSLKDLAWDFAGALTGILAASLIL
jgi:putative lipoprotein